MTYYKNITSGKIHPFTYNPGADWTLATQEEIDAYLLVNAKVAKIIELKSDLQAFEEAGFVYATWTFGLSDAGTGNVSLKSGLLSYQSSNVSVTGATKKYNLPGGHDLSIAVGQKIEVAGFTEAANNGIKTVTVFASDEITVSEALTDEAVGDAVDISSVDRYKYFDTTNIQKDFVDISGFSDFCKGICTEKDRIMMKYNDYKAQTNACADVAAVDAITISFTA